jgi:8-oxo-dGTP pyrophosphatase MutT (NUDIX family)
VAGPHAGGQARRLVVRAAGGIVCRDAQVLLVHRPKYDDWTFPKGKADPGESDEDCALREVEEETGLRCALERELPSSSYTDSRGRHKLVRYWLMRPTEGSFEPTEEVDEIAWLSVPEAGRRLSYDRDRAILGSLGVHDP